MGRFYFDIHNDWGVVFDDEGVDVPDLHAARRLALETLGQAIIDDARTSKGGVTRVDVRDGPSRVLIRATAAVALEHVET